MRTIDNSTMALPMSKFENSSAALWLEQTFRKIQGKPLLQEVVLAKVVEQAAADDNLLGILLFGSLAAGTHTWKSDIDLIFVYAAHEPTSGLANQFVEGVAVQYFFVTLATLAENIQTVPYLLHMFAEAKILFDREDRVAPVIAHLKHYFASHPEMAAEWDRFKALHQVEKKGSACQQTTIIQRWNELEGKYSGGEIKRTFFRELG